MNFSNTTGILLSNAFGLQHRSCSGAFILFWYSASYSVFSQDVVTYIIVFVFSFLIIKQVYSQEDGQEGKFKGYTGCRCWYNSNFNMNINNN